MWDAAFPPASPPKWEAVAGYIGGNTPHVWTDQEWARQQARWRLPIFTRSHDGDPSADAAHAVRWMTAHHVPKGVCVALDFETRVDATYLHAFDAAIIRAGWKAMVYGSKQAVLRNPKPSGGYWAAEWTNVPHLVPGTAATQYGSDVTLGTQYDASLVADSTPLWDTHKEDTMALIFDSVDEFKQAVRAAMGLREGEAAASDSDVRVILRGDPTHTDNLNSIHADTTAILQAVQTAADPAAMAALLAGQLKVTGISTAPGGVVTVTFAP